LFKRNLGSNVFFLVVISLFSEDAYARITEHFVRETAPISEEAWSIRRAF